MDTFIKKLRDCPFKEVPLITNLETHLNSLDDYFKKKIKGKTGVAAAYAGFTEQYLPFFVDTIVVLIREKGLGLTRSPLKLVPDSAPVFDLPGSTPLRGETDVNFVKNLALQMEIRELKGKAGESSSSPIFIDQGIQTDLDEVELKLQHLESEHSRINEILKDTLSDVKERSISIDRAGTTPAAVLDIDSLHFKIDEIYHTLCDLGQKIDSIEDTSFKGTEALKIIQASGQESINALSRGVREILSDDAAIRDGAATLLDKVAPTLAECIPTTFADAVSNKLNSLDPSSEQFFHLHPS